jgi:hypothetical protein
MALTSQQLSGRAGHNDEVFCEVATEITEPDRL